MPQRPLLRAAFLAVQICAVSGALSSNAGQATEIDYGARFQRFDDAVKYVQCGVCEAAARSVFLRSVELKRELPSVGAVTSALDELVQSACDPETADGRWIKSLDVHRPGPEEGADGSRLRVSMRPGELSRCGRECRTIELACHRVFDEWDDSIADALATEKVSAESLADALCRRWTRSCRAPRTVGGGPGFWQPSVELPLPAHFALYKQRIDDDGGATGRYVDEERFVPQTDKEAAAEAVEQKLARPGGVDNVFGKDPKAGLVELEPGVWVAPDLADERRRRSVRESLKEVRKASNEQGKTKKKNKNQNKKKKKKKKGRRKGEATRERARAERDL
jgi:hypothetical protein